MSEQTLDKLIAKVKSEAIDAAEKEAEQIIADAKAKAQQIIDHAEAKKTQLLEDAHTESEAILNKGQIALQQAARDVQIAVKNDLMALFKSVFEAEIETAFRPELYDTLITKVVDALGDHIDIALPNDTKDQLVSAIQKKVVTSHQSINIIKKEHLLSGLSITKTDQGWSYDITAKDIAELLNHHLNDKWITLLNSK